MFSIFVKQFLFLVLFVLFGYVIGKILLRNFSFFSIIETYAFSIAIGWGFLGCLIMLLGFLGWLQPFVLFPTLTIIFVVFLLAIIRNKYFRFDCLSQFFKNRLNLLFFITLCPFILLLFILLFYLSAYPITEWDAISYHLPVVKEFISQGKIVPTFFLRFPVFPQLVEMFFVPALMLGNPLLTNLTQYAMAIVLALLIYSFAQRYINRGVGLFSALVFLSSPVVSKFAVLPYVEVGTTLFCFSAFYAMVIWINEKKLSYGILSAIFWGLAFGSKYYAILFFLIVFLSTIIVFGKQVRLSHLIPMLLIMLLIAFPWYLRSKVYSGDWFFPMFFDGINGTGVWNLADFRSHTEHIRSLGLGKNIKLLFMLPINLLRYGDCFGGNVGPFIIIFLGSFFFLRKWSRFTTEFMLIVTAYGLIWFYNFQQARYLFPVLPILSLLSGWTLKNVNSHLGVKSRQFWTCSIIAVLIFGCINCAKVIRNKGTVPVTSAEKFEYLARQIPTYKAINFLNNMGQKDIIVYALLDEGSVFYHKNKVIGDWFGPAAYRNVMPYITKPTLLHEILKNYGAQYLLVKKGRVETPLSSQIDKIIHKLEEGPFKIIYCDHNALVFKIL